jgi:hypothetical protein
MGQSVNHTVQCVLILNVFMEKTFVLLWAWYTILAALTVANISAWMFGLFSTASAEHFIFNHLEMSGESLFEDEPDKQPNGFHLNPINKQMMMVRFRDPTLCVKIYQQISAQRWPLHSAIDCPTCGCGIEHRSNLQNVARPLPD